MKLNTYLKLKGIKANKWAKEVGLPISGVYAWLKDTTPTLTNIMEIKRATEGAVGPEDWLGE